MLLHNSKLGARNHGSTVHNAFGDSYIYALWIESNRFPPYEYGFHLEMSFVRLNKWLASYVGLGFCTHCVNGAQGVGVDATNLKATVARNIDNYMSGDIDFPNDMAEAIWLANIAGDIELRKYLDYGSSVIEACFYEQSTERIKADLTDMKRRTARISIGIGD